MPKPFYLRFIKLPMGITEIAAGYFLAFLVAKMRRIAYNGK